MNKADRRRFRRLRRSVRGIQDQTAGAFKPLLHSLHQDARTWREGSEWWEKAAQVWEQIAYGNITLSLWTRIRFLFTGRIHIPQES